MKNGQTCRIASYGFLNAESRPMDFYINHIFEHMQIIIFEHNIRTHVTINIDHISEFLFHHASAWSRRNCERERYNKCW